MATVFVAMILLGLVLMLILTILMLMLILTILMLMLILMMLMLMRRKATSEKVPHPGLHPPLYRVEHLQIMIIMKMIRVTISMIIMMTMIIMMIMIILMIVVKFQICKTRSGRCSQMFGQVQIEAKFKSDFYGFARALAHCTWA